MKTNSEYEMIARIARQSLVLAALLAMVLSTASISCAQSSATSPATSAAKQSAASAKAPALPAAKPAAKGSHEGIAVHGHWTIEVKNPDGKVANRVEFENSLCTTQALAAGGGGNFLVGGDQLIAQLLAGTGGPYYQMWTVQLSPSPPTGTTPCVLATQGIAPFLLTSGSNPLAANQSVPCNVINTAPNTGGSSLTVVCTGLAVSAQSSPPTLTLSGTLEALTGSAVSYPFTIGAVSTNLALVTNPINLNTEFIYFPCTATYCGTFTATSLPSPGVTVQQGQNISVMVSFTFSSPS